MEPALFAHIALAGYDLDRMWNLGGGSIFSNAAFQSFRRVFLLDDDLASLVRRWERMRASRGALPYCDVRGAWDKFHLDHEGELGFLARIRVRTSSGYSPRQRRIPGNFRRCPPRARRHRSCRQALSNYQIATGSFPGKLENLVPEYGDHVPADPFGDGPMHMKRDGDDLVLYSIGADCRDDGGTLWDDVKREGDIVFRVNGREHGRKTSESPAFRLPSEFWNELEIRQLRSEAEAVVLYDTVYSADDHPGFDRGLTWMPTMIS